MYSLTIGASSHSSEDYDDYVEYECAMELNARIHKARTDAKLTQDELADRVGKTRGAVSQWESGQIVPRVSTLQAIAKATGKPL